MRLRDVTAAAVALKMAGRRDDVKDSNGAAVRADIRDGDEMPGQKSSEELRLGFLRVVDVESIGFVGGMLVANRVGRPLEFQCTTPVRPNRTQAILYGPTLLPFVCSELIGKTLYERLAVKPQVVLVDQEALLDLRAYVPVPVACLVDAVAATDLPDQTRIRIGLQTIRFHPDYPEDSGEVATRTEGISADADMQEPLERIREALQETLRTEAA